MVDVKTAVQWGGGTFLLLGGVAAIPEGIAGVLAGLLWIPTGLILLPATRQVTLGLIDAATGQDFASIGTGFLVVIVLTGFVAGAAVYPADDGPTEPPTAIEATPTPTPNQTPETTFTATNAPTATVSPTAAPTPTATVSPEPPTSTPTPGLTVTVVDVVDGDTVDIRYQNGSSDTVRLLGVDTPEVHTETDPAEFEGVPDNSAGRDCLRAEGHDASEYATDQLDGVTVRLRFDDQADRRGSFGRLLAYVVIDGENFNYRLVAQGYARVYDSQFEQSDRFYAAESDAQASETGVWRCRNVETSTPTPTPTSTSGSGELAVRNVHADAEGNDHENENDEYVTFENTGGSALDIGGWTVEDEAGHTYTVPSGFELGAGKTVTLYTGSGSDSGSELYWGSDSAIWNNGGDTVIVTDDGGNTVLEYSYS